MHEIRFGILDFAAANARRQPCIDVMDKVFSNIRRRAAPHEVALKRRAIITRIAGKVDVGLNRIAALFLMPIFF